MKYLPFVLATLLLACMPECEVGEYETCTCLHGSYLNACNPEGYFPECNCYDNGGNGQQGTDGDDWPPTGDDYTPGDTRDELLEYFPWCEATYQDNCNEDEILIPCTDTCWRRCPIGMYWEDDGCHGTTYSALYSEVVAACKQLDSRYRLPELEEVAYLLDQCYVGTFNYGTNNYCSPFQTSAMRFVMDPPWNMFFTSWVGSLDWCIDQYGFETQSCAWYTQFYVNTIMDTNFNWLYANGYVGAVAAGGICVRTM